MPYTHNYAASSSARLTRVWLCAYLLTGAAMLLALPVPQARATLRAVPPARDATLVALLRNISVTDCTPDMLSALPLLTVVRIAPALFAAQVRHMCELTPGLLGSFWCCRPGLCQCRFRTELHRPVYNPVRLDILLIRRCECECRC